MAHKKFQNHKQCFGFSGEERVRQEGRRVLWERMRRAAQRFVQLQRPALHVRRAALQLGRKKANLGILDCHFHSFKYGKYSAVLDLKYAKMHC